MFLEGGEAREQDTQVLSANTELMRISRKLGTMAAALLAVAMAPGLTESKETRATCFGKRPTIVGTPRSDVLQGSSGTDVIAGFGGDDRIYGNAGEDRICTGHGDDVAIGGGAWDRINTGKGNDKALGNGDADDLLGAKGDDVLKGGPGPSDFITPGPGQDKVVGGGYFNVIQYWRSRRAIKANIKKGLIRGWGRDRVKGVYQVEGTQFADTMIGSRRTNVFLGFGGNDQIRAGSGRDAVYAGEGNDFLRGGAGKDWIGFADSRNPVRASLSRRRARGEGRDRMKNFESMFGSRFTDYLVGNSEDNAFVGGFGGDDEIVGRRGDDDFYRLDDNQILRGGPGRDLVVYWYGMVVDLDVGSAQGLGFSDVLYSIEDLWGYEESDVFHGSGRSNELITGGGQDTLNGKGGNDRLLGGTQDDGLDGGDGRDHLDGGSGVDGCFRGEQTLRCEIPPSPNELIGDQSDRRDAWSLLKALDAHSERLPLLLLLLK